MKRIRSHYGLVESQMELRITRYLKAMYSDGVGKLQ